MEAWIQPFVTDVALITEGLGAALVAVAILQAVLSALLSPFRHYGPLEIRFRLGRWLALTLEFLLAADILRTAIAPTWNEIGQLGAIIVIRTVLNFFLEREIRERESSQASDQEVSPEKSSSGVRVERNPVFAH